MAARNIILIAACFALTFIGLGNTVHAASRLIIIPTARTIREGTYNLSLERRGSLLNTDQQPQWSIKGKWGFRRSEAGVNLDRDTNNKYRLRFNGKYFIRLGPNDDSALAFGFQSLGVDTSWTTYSVVSHRISKADLHLGIFNSSEGLNWFTGADYLIIPRLDLMADYVNSEEIEWSLGFEYELAEHWSVKAGTRFQSGETNTVIELKYIDFWQKRSAS
jgi:hypothetical protein